MHGNQSLWFCRSVLWHRTLACTAGLASAAVRGESLSVCADCVTTARAALTRIYRAAAVAAAAAAAAAVAVVAARGFCVSSVSAQPACESVYQTLPAPRLPSIYHLTATTTTADSCSAAASHVKRAVVIKISYRCSFVRGWLSSAHLRAAL